MKKETNNKSTTSIGSKVSRRNTNTTRGKLKGKKNKHPRLKKVFLIVFLLGILVMLVGIGVFCGIFFSDKFALSKDDLLLSNANTIVYDRDGNVIAELSGSENRKIIGIDEMTEYLPEAYIAIEDERFYKHKGVDVKRTLAATTTYILKGDSSFGGSTITQQLIKNITNERENSGSAGVERKIKEMSRAYQVEKMITKQQILELYLNIIPLGADGGDICGVEMASMYYFNKHANELAIEECAFLAGINNAPNTYNPFKNSEDEQKQSQVITKIKNRTQTVLKKMKELGYITDEQYQTAYQNTENGLAFSKGTLPNSTIKDYFIKAAVDNVVDDLVEKKGMSVEYVKSRVYGGGYKIHTTEVATVQNNLKEVYTSGDYILTTKESPTHSQSAMVIIDHTKGQVVGCMGGLGDDVDAIGLDRATVIKRQTGSSIKPIVTYGYGIESGTITASTVYNDEKIYFGDWYPKNDSGGFSGYMSVRTAIERSVNVVACKIMAELGPDNAIDFARKCGISSLVKASEDKKANDSNLPAMALGGQTKGITPLEMAAAYAMIANNGVYIEPTFYTTVEDSSGGVILEANPRTERVMTEQHAYIMKTLLKQPVEGANGTAKVCRMDNFDVGAKTGTTNDKVDNWLCGMTNYYTAASWYGYDPVPGKDPIRINGTGNNAAKLWAEVMKKIHKDLPSATFSQPSGIVKVEVCKKSGLKATNSCSDKYEEYFVAGEEPKECEGHSLKVCDESGKLATEYCTNTHYYSFLPEKERNPKWKAENPAPAAPSEYCSIHVTPADVVDEPPTDNHDTTPETTTDLVVPNVVGLSEANAKIKLKDYDVEVKTKSDSSKTNGVVLSQSLYPGLVVEKGVKITITVNKVEKKPDASPTKKPEDKNTNPPQGNNNTDKNTKDNNNTDKPSTDNPVTDTIQ